MDIATLTVLTIPQLATRCEIEGIPLGEGAIRRMVRAARLPASYVGTKAMIRWKDLLDYFDHSEA